MDRLIKITSYFQVVFLLILFSTTVRAATGPGKSAELYGSADSLELIINGWEYHLKTAGNGHPYFESKVWQYGDIESLLGKAENVLLNYDIFQDALLVQFIKNGITNHIVLNPRYVKSFKLGNNQFVNLLNYAGFRGDPGRNYFELGFSGKLLLLYAPEKNLVENDHAGGSGFVLSARRYFFLNQQLHEIKSLPSLQRIFPGEKKNIRHFLKQNRISLKTASDIQMKQIAAFCNSLIPE